jgi:hypothetical protein
MQGDRAIGLAMKETWIERDASGRPTGITRVAGQGILFNKAGS